MSLMRIVLLWMNLSGVSGKGAQEAIVGVTMRGTPESLLDESNQTHLVVSPEHNVLENIEEMPNLIFYVGKEYSVQSSNNLTCR